MVFVVGSSDQTQKVVLNSKTRTSGTSSVPIFTMFEPIKTPYDSIGLMNLECCIVTTPSLYSPGVIDNPNNWLYTSAAPNTNLYNSVYPAFAACYLSDLTNTNTMVLYLLRLAMMFNNCYITLPSYAATTVLEDTFYYNATAQQFHKGIDKITADTNNYTTNDNMITFLQEYLSYLHTITITLSISDTTKDLQFAGEWTKIFGLTPKKKDLGESYSLTGTNSLTLELNSKGYRYVNLHSNFARAVCTANSNNILAPTDVLWTIPIVSNPGDVTFYNNVNTAGKIPYQVSIIETMEIYFTDEWGDFIMDLSDFTITLTFDFSQKDTVPEQPTTKRARQTLSMLAMG